MWQLARLLDDPRHFPELHCFLLKMVWKKRQRQKFISPGLRLNKSWCRSRDWKLTISRESQKGNYFPALCWLIATSYWLESRGRPSSLSSGEIPSERWVVLSESHWFAGPHTQVRNWIISALCFERNLSRFFSTWEQKLLTSIYLQTKWQFWRLRDPLWANQFSGFMLDIISRRIYHPMRS